MIVRTLWLAPLRRHPLRFLATVAGVAIGVASVVSTVLASRSAVAFLGRDVEEISGRAVLEVTAPGGVRLGDVGALRAVAGLVVAEPVVEGAALAPALGDLLRVLGVDLLSSPALDPIELETGGGDAAFDAMLLGDGAAVSSRLADELGVAPGDRFELVARSTPATVTVAAVWEPERFASAWDRVVLVDVATAQELFGRLDRVDRVELVPRGGVEIDADALRGRVEALFSEEHRVAPVSARREEGERMVRALRFNLGALSGVSVLVGTVLVATALATSVVQRRSAIALLRSLGASRAQLARAVLAEAGAIGALGGAVGVLAGWGGARAALSGVRASVSTIAQGAVAGDVRLAPGWAALGVGLGVASSLAAAVLPLREALRTPPVQGLAAEHPESVTQRPWRARALLLAGLFGAAALFASLPPVGDRPIFALVSALCLLGSLVVLSAPLVDTIAAVRPFSLRRGGADGAEHASAPPAEPRANRDEERARAQRTDDATSRPAARGASPAATTPLAEGPPDARGERPPSGEVGSHQRAESRGTHPALGTGSSAPHRWLAALVPVRLAQAALEASRARAAWAAGAVGVAVGLAVSMATMVGSFRQTVVDWTAQTMSSDLFVRPMRAESGVTAGGLDREVARTAAELFGADAIDPYHQAEAYVDGKRVSLGGARFEVNVREGGVPFLDGRPSREVFREALEEGEVVVNEPFWRRFGLGRGDVVELETASGVVRRGIAGVYRDYSGHTGRVVMDLEAFLRHYPDEGPANLGVFLPPAADVAAARTELQDALGARFALDVLPNRELRREVLEVFERTFAVTIALQVVASVVAAIAVVTVLGALVRERRRELALVRVLGGSRAQVAGVVVGEALVLGLAGAVGGLAVGLVIGWVLVAVVNVQSFGWTLRFLPPWRAILVTAGAVLPACLAAGLVPALAGLRSHPREALREA